MSTTPNARKGKRPAKAVHMAPQIRRAEDLPENDPRQDELYVLAQLRRKYPHHELLPLDDIRNDYAQGDGPWEELHDLNHCAHELAQRLLDDPRSTTPAAELRRFATRNALRTLRQHIHRLEQSFLVTLPVEWQFNLGLEWTKTDERDLQQSMALFRTTQRTVTPQ